MLNAVRQPEVGLLLTAAQYEARGPQRSNPHPNPSPDPNQERPAQSAAMARANAKKEEPRLRSFEPHLDKVMGTLTLTLALANPDPNPG